MDKNQTYQINLGNLTQGTHQFRYNIDNEFFKNIESNISIAENVDCKVILECERTETMTTCNFAITGNLGLQCDRSLKEFDYPININSTIYYKFGLEYAELSEDLVTIPEKNSVVNFAQPIYDLLAIEVPSRKLHPDHREEKQEDNDFFFTTSTSINGKEKQEESKEAETIDPRWAALQKLKK